MGKVYLIGAGPGDPGLITLKAIEALKEADCVFYDYLVNPEILKYARSGAELIKHTKGPMDKLLIKRAKEGKIIARLKSGDPFVFGRGSEEAQAMAKAGIPFEVISGVTSAVSVPAYAGIPLTDRRINSQCTFITGQEDPKKKASNIDWGTKGTLVFLMGAGNLKKIAGNLLKHGRDKNTPVAIITWGTLPEQKTIIATLSKMARKQVKPPSVIVVGEVVRLRKALNWFEEKPLFGKRVLVTAPNKMAPLLEREGAHAIEFPVIEIRPLRFKVKEISGYDWLIFTSVNGVRYALQELKDVRELKGPKICAIGPKTREAIEELGMKVEFIPFKYSNKDMARAFKNRKIKNKRILILRSSLAEETLEKALESLGNIVDSIPVYETRMLPIKKRIPPFDCITFTSSSCVRNFPKSALKGKTVATIGPATTKTCRELGIKEDVQAKKYTLEGLVEAIKDYYDKSN